MITQTTPSIVALVTNLWFSSRLQDYARARGMAVSTLTGAAVHGLAVRSAAVVIVDLSLPRAVWEPALRALRGTPETSNIPVLAFGPHVAVDDHAAARAAGATRVVSNRRMSESLAPLLDRLLGLGDGIADVADD